MNLQLLDPAGKSFPAIDNGDIGATFNVPKGRYRAILDRPSADQVAREVEITADPASSTIDLLVP